MVKKKFIVAKRKNKNVAYEYHTTYSTKKEALRMVRRLKQKGMDAKVVIM